MMTTPTEHPLAELDYALHDLATQCDKAEQAASTLRRTVRILEKSIESLIVKHGVDRAFRQCDNEIQRWLTLSAIAAKLENQNKQHRSDS